MSIPVTSYSVPGNLSRPNIAPRDGIPRKFAIQGERFFWNIDALWEFCSPLYHRSSHEMSKFKDFFLRVLLAARISQLT